MTFTPPSSHPLGLPLGLAGAISPTRYVGGTATVAPTTGTWLVGDFVVTADAKVFVCTVAGSPGTWTQAGGGSSSGALLNGVSVATDLTVTATTAGAAQTYITSGSVTYDGATAVKIEVYIPLVAGVGSDVIVTLWEDSSDLNGRIIQVSGASATGYGFIIKTPSAGAHVYIAKAFRGAINGTLFGSLGFPAWLRITRV